MPVPPIPFGCPIHDSFIIMGGNEGTRSCRDRILPDRHKMIAALVESWQLSRHPATSILTPTHADDEVVVMDGAPVRFQEVVHSNQTEEAECASSQILLGRPEWTYTRMPD